MLCASFERIEASTITPGDDDLVHGDAMKQSRTIIAIILTVVVVLVAAVAIGYAALPKPQGRIEMSATEFDFGTIPNTGPVSQTFYVRNTGDGPLEIAGLSTSCGCTTAKIDSHRLAPGEATDLTVTYDPLVHGGATGEFMRIVYVRSSDPDTPEANLIIQVTVDEP